MSGIDDLVHEIRPASGDPEGALVLLHGRATDEHDLGPLLDELDPERRLLGITPRGPLSLPPGGAHWYAPRSVGFPDPRTFLSTLELLGGWFDALPAALGVSLGKTVVGGFSQGAAMTYALGLGEGRPRPAGGVGLGGFLPWVDGFRVGLADLPAGHPVAVGPGQRGPRLAPGFGRIARGR